MIKERRVSVLGENKACRREEGGGGGAQTSLLPLLAMNTDESQKGYLQCYPGLPHAATYLPYLPIYLHLRPYYLSIHLLTYYSAVYLPIYPLTYN